MKILLISMPDVAPILIHEAAIHLPNHGIASVGGNIDPEHEVRLIDLVRKRRSIKKYLTKVISKMQPDLVGLSAMAWQYDTCLRIARLIKALQPDVKIVIGGDHATLMHEEIAASEEAQVIDFMIRGEGEEACRRLVNALAGQDEPAEIPSLSYKKDGVFIHNPGGKNLDLSTLKLPLRDKRRLTWGYHLVHSKIEVIETSRGCTRSCNFCSIKHMYGRSFRTFPIERVLEDIDDIYFRKKTRCIFITDDNIVLDQARLMDLCDAIIAKEYKGLKLFVQADCISIARNEDMVCRMAAAGFASIFLGIENVSRQNLSTACKGDIIASAKKAVENCHKFGIMVIGGLIFGFPEDTEISIKENYEFFQSLQCDAAYCQILTPYPKTGIREHLLELGLITNPTDYKKYNGLWANVRTKYLDSAQLHYQFWYQRQVVLGWWKPSSQAGKQDRLWIFIWRFLFKPLLKLRYALQFTKNNPADRYQQEISRLHRMNRFADLEEFGE